MKIFQNRRIKGAISLFLIIITIPTMLLAGVLIDGSRIASARAITQEATDLAASGVLASYNLDLKEDYGLFAFEKPDAKILEEIYRESLEATLMANGFSGDEEYSEKIWNIMKTTLTGEKSYMGADFLNLYDFSVESSNVTLQFPLAQQEVLENQMIEHAKFRGIYTMVDRLEIFQNLEKMKQENQKNQETVAAAKEKMEIDKKNQDVGQQLEKLRTEVRVLNEKRDAYYNIFVEYYGILKAKMQVIQYDTIDHEEGDEVLSNEVRLVAKRYTPALRNRFVNCATELHKQSVKVLKQANDAKKAVERAIRSEKNFQSNYSKKKSENESIKSLMEDSQESEKQYEEYGKVFDRILQDEDINGLSKGSNISKDLKTTLSEIDKAITKHSKEIEEKRKNEQNSDHSEGEEPEKIAEYYFYYLPLEKNAYTKNLEEALGNKEPLMTRTDVLHSYGAAISIHFQHVLRNGWDLDEINPLKNRDSETSNKAINKDSAKAAAKQDNDPDSNEAGEQESRKTVPQEIYNVRPSKNFVQSQIEGSHTSNRSLFSENGAPDISAAQNALNQPGILSQVLGTIRDDVLSMSYLFGTFKTRLTGVKKLTKSGMEKSEQESPYMPKWRIEHDEGELNLRFAPKNEMETVLRAEVEYLIFGAQSDQSNETMVFATIFSERLVNNMLAVYANNEIKTACHAAAAAASAATLGTVPEPVFFWIFITAWATAETTMDMNYLIGHGYKIPLFKTKDNLILRLNTGPTPSNSHGLVSNYGAADKGIFVCYEDYLLLILLLTDRNTRIQRAADLVEMNMKSRGQSDFSMGTAYTYLKVDNKISLRYLFGNTAPFSATYKETGFSDRLYFNHVVNMGY